MPVEAGPCGSGHSGGAGRHRDRRSEAVSGAVPQAAGGRIDRADGYPDTDTLLCERETSSCRAR